MKKILVLLTILLPLLAVAKDKDKDKEKIHHSNSVITLSAQGIIYKPADQLEMSIGVLTFKETAEDALHENTEIIDEVVKSLIAAELSADNYETGHFSITPTYTPYPKNPPEGWKQSINGYEVSNQILIHTDLIDSAGKFIDVASRAGANNINSVQFVLNDQRKYWKEAIALATTNAISDAQAIADAAGLRLLQIKSITLDNAQQLLSRSNLHSAKAMNNDSSPVIEAGNIKIVANVTIIYEIAPK